MGRIKGTRRKRRCQTVTKEELTVTGRTPFKVQGSFYGELGGIRKPSHPDAPLDSGDYASIDIDLWRLVQDTQNLIRNACETIAAHRFHSTFCSGNHCIHTRHYAFLLILLQYPILRTAG